MPIFNRQIREDQEATKDVILMHYPSEEVELLDVKPIKFRRVGDYYVTIVDYSLRRKPISFRRE